MKISLLFLSILLSMSAIGFEIPIQLKMIKGDKQIFLMDVNTRVERGDILNLFDGENNLGEIEILKISKTGNKILTRAVNGSFSLVKGNNYKLVKDDAPQVSSNMETKHFGHFFILDNTNRSLVYAIDKKDGTSGSGRLNITQSGLGFGYEHMVNMFDDLFHVGGGASYELGKTIGYTDVNFSDGSVRGGASNLEIKSIITVFGNLSLNIQETFDLYFGLNFSSMALTDTTHSSFGYQAGIAAMKNHIRLGIVYRVNTYSGDIDTKNEDGEVVKGKEKIIANDIIGTVGYVF